MRSGFSFKSFLPSRYCRQSLDTIGSIFAASHLQAPRVAAGTETGESKLIQGYGGGHRHKSSSAPSLVCSTRQEAYEAVPRCSRRAAAKCKMVMCMVGLTASA